MSDFLSDIGDVAGKLLNPVSTVIGGIMHNDASSAASREQMGFQERMSSTAFQRSADDLQKAGLNRILALGSPESTPSGSMPDIQNVGQMVGSSASDSLRMAQDMRESQSRISVNDSTKKLQAAQTAATAASAKKISAETVPIANTSKIEAKHPTISGFSRLLGQIIGGGTSSAKDVVPYLIPK